MGKKARKARERSARSTGLTVRSAGSNGWDGWLTPGAIAAFRDWYDKLYESMAFPGEARR